MGEGILRRLAEEGLDFQDIDAILLSHFHPDYTLDLWAYFFASRWPDFNPGNHACCRSFSLRKRLPLPGGRLRPTLCQKG